MRPTFLSLAFPIYAAASAITHESRQQDRSSYTCVPKFQQGKFTLANSWRAYLPDGPTAGGRVEQVSGSTKDPMQRYTFEAQGDHFLIHPAESTAVAIAQDQPTFKLANSNPADNKQQWKVLCQKGCENTGDLCKIVAVSDENQCINVEGGKLKLSPCNFNASPYWNFEGNYTTPSASVPIPPTPSNSAAPGCKPDLNYKRVSIANSQRIWRKQTAVGEAVMKVPDDYVPGSDLKPVQWRFDLRGDSFLIHPEDNRLFSISADQGGFKLAPTNASDDKQSFQVTCQMDCKGELSRGYFIGDRCHITPAKDTTKCVTVDGTKHLVLESCDTSKGSQFFNFENFAHPDSGGANNGNGTTDNNNCSAGKISNALAENDKGSSGGSGNDKVIIGLLATNLLFTIILVVVGLLTYIQRGGRAGRTVSPSYAPVKTNDKDHGKGYRVDLDGPRYTD